MCRVARPPQHAGTARITREIGEARSVGLLKKCLQFGPERLQRNYCSDVLWELVSQSGIIKCKSMAKVLF